MELHDLPHVRQPLVILRRGDRRSPAHAGGGSPAQPRRMRDTTRNYRTRDSRIGGTDPVAKVTMPQLGESVAEGTIGRWLKQPGDTVAKYEPLLEVITDKVNAEVPSPFAGVLKEILAEEGATVPNDAEIAVIETEDEALAGGTGAPPPVALEKDASTSDEGVVAVEPANLDAASSGQPAQGPAGSDEGPERAAATTGTAATATAGTAPTATAPVGVGPGSDSQGDPNARMTPAVRRLLREHGLEAGQITGTGGGGRGTPR